MPLKIKQLFFVYFLKDDFFMETFWILSDHKPWPYEVPQNICRLHFSIEIFF